MPERLINGISLAYETFGSHDGEPVILVHAFPLCGKMWHMQAEMLRDELNCHVIIPDLRGFGASDVSIGLALMEQFASDILALADALALPRFTLGGLSMGGYVSLALLRIAPERVQGLILADTKATLDSPEALANRETLAKQAERDGPPAVAETMLPRLLTPTTIAQHPEIVDTVREMVLSNAPAGIAAASRGMALRHDATDLLPQIACPTLVIVGDEDASAPASDARFLFEHIPTATLVTLHGAGHLSNLEAPEQFNDSLLHFVKSLER